MALKHLLVLLVSAPLAFSQGGGLPAKESFSYNIEWRLFNAGTATLRVDAAGSERRIVATADATGAVALLYHVHDIFETFVAGPSKPCPPQRTKTSAALP